MNRTCTQCGTQLQPDQGFCAECGTAWTAPADTMPSQAVAQPPAQQPVVMAPPPAAPSGGTGKVILVSVIAIVVLAALGGGGWLLARERNARAAAVAPPAVKSAATIPSPAVQDAPVATPAAAADGAAAALATTATDASAAAAASKPCSLVSQADMEQILSLKIVNITSTETSCSYFTDATMSVDIDSTWTGGKEAMTASKGYNANPGLFEPVAGIGDEAYMQAAGVLHVLKGDVYIVINSRQYPEQDKTEPAIARKALERLK